MKKILSVVLVVILLISGVFLLTGCGSDSSETKTKTETKAPDLSAYAGVYTGKYTKLVGDDKKNETEVFSLELKADGTGIHKRDNLEIDVTWSLDGTNFKMTETFMGMTIDYTGTITATSLDIFNGDPTDMWTYEYVYAK